MFNHEIIALRFRFLHLKWFSSTTFRRSCICHVQHLLKSQTALILPKAAQLGFHFHRNNCNAATPGGTCLKIHYWGWKEKKAQLPGGNWIYELSVKRRVLYQCASTATHSHVQHITHLLHFYKFFTKQDDAICILTEMLWAEKSLPGPGFEPTTFQLVIQLNHRAKLKIQIASLWTLP